MKLCITCGVEKSFDFFYKHPETKDGYFSQCKECKKSYEKEKKNYLKYDKTEKGVIRVIYKAQKCNSKRRKLDFPSYSKNDFSVWLYDNGFKLLYDNWVFSGYLKDLKPSVDRFNDYKPYSLDNIRLVVWKENREKQYDDILLGRSTSGERCKPVVQYDSNGKFIAEYVSFSSAKRINGYSMERSLNTGKIDKKGFKWSYKNEYIK